MTQAADGPVIEGITLNMTTRAQLMGEMFTCLSARRGFALATLNLDHIVKLRRDPDFRAAYLAQTHVVADGNPIVWVSKLAGQPVELLPGSELIAPLCALAAKAGVPVAFLGSRQEVLDAAADQLVAEYPGLQVVCKIAPSLGFDPASAAAGEMLGQIADSGAGLCFLALGAPKQEILAARGHDAVPGCGFVSIGAGLDFIAGHQTRAPEWVRKLAMEWAWRMVSNPRRLAKRYLDCALILPGLARNAKKGSNKH